MADVHPSVRYLIVCEDVRLDDDQPRRITLAGLISTIRSLDEPAFPLLYREFCVFLQLTECRGEADICIEVRHADSDEIVFQTQHRHIAFVTDPLEVLGITFRIRNCLFKEPGLHWVQFWYNQTMIAQQPVLLRSSS